MVGVCIYSGIFTFTHSVREFKKPFADLIQSMSPSNQEWQIPGVSTVWQSSHTTIPHYAEGFNMWWLAFYAWLAFSPL